MPGWAFLRRLINLTIGVSNPAHRIRLNLAAKADLRAWLVFLVSFNGKEFFLSDQWISSRALHLYTDASGSQGYGGLLGREWFMGSWPTSWQDKPITIKEFFPIVAALELWCQQLAQQRIIFHTDNMALTHIINKSSAKDTQIMTLVRHCVVICMRHNIYFKAQHVPGVNNVLADRLSRQQVADFHKLAPWAKSTPEQLPVHILPQNWFRG